MSSGRIVLSITTVAPGQPVWARLGTSGLTTTGGMTITGPERAGTG